MAQEKDKTAVEITAQLWCLPQFEHKIMEPDFAMAIAKAMESYASLKVAEQKRKDVATIRSFDTPEFEQNYPELNKRFFAEPEILASEIIAQAIEKGANDG